jgi:hypothetical protein
VFEVMGFQLGTFLLVLLDIDGKVKEIDRE